MNDWAAAGHPNAATARFKEKARVKREQEAEVRRHKGELARRARLLNQSGAEASSTVFNLPANLDDRRGR